MVIIAMGGLAQIIAGIFELRNRNTFAGTAFTACGLFWWSLVLIRVNPFVDVGIAAGGAVAMGFCLLLWGIFCGLSAIYSAVGQILNA